MAALLEIFLTMFVLMFGIFCLVFGVFTAYFGSGRSRNIGGGLCLLGIVAFIMVLWFTAILPFAVPHDFFEWDLQVVIDGFIAVLGFIVGALVALGIFLGAIMKS
jgi:hypothetical protein